ncbi:uncharacterized protein MONBRDRAFT_7091 [Monosiga brevicollis MX1]|uniref:Uncharacterized protein n=1 Tax=Monosiga brevicollis TaxID=81824 RepID=A9UVW5_MONBE|nr:uncharacterized protein MONBRDRAFT_7091 [Monosiga brevicollis MX1]EDQ90660.1 predicted protein [Monosiga brevicollis MX1]|eukprot:XP_001744711.1 hypothetical protein [Monosiga brevicollis MX1]
METLVHRRLRQHILSWALAADLRHVFVAAAWLGLPPSAPVRVLRPPSNRANSATASLASSPTPPSSPEVVNPAKRSYRRAATAPVAVRSPDMFRSCPAQPMHSPPYIPNTNSGSTPSPRRPVLLPDSPPPSMSPHPKRPRLSPAASPPLMQAASLRPDSQPASPADAHPQTHGNLHQAHMGEALPEPVEPAGMQPGETLLDASNDSATDLEPQVEFYATQAM